jgi:hypothetical protein
VSKADFSDKMWSVWLAQWSSVMQNMLAGTRLGQVRQEKTSCPVFVSAFCCSLTWCVLSQPVHVALNLGNAFADLVRIPVAEYNASGGSTIVTLGGILGGATNLVSTVAVEVLNVATSSVVGVAKGTVVFLLLLFVCFFFVSYFLVCASLSDT